MVNGLPPMPIPNVLTKKPATVKKDDQTSHQKEFVLPSQNADVNMQTKSVAKNIAKNTPSDNLMAIKTNENKDNIITPLQPKKSNIIKQDNNMQKDRLAIELRNNNLPPIPYDNKQSSNTSDAMQSSNSVSNALKRTLHYGESNLPKQIGNFVQLRDNIYRNEDKTYGMYINGEMFFRGFNI